MNAVGIAGDGRGSPGQRHDGSPLVLVVGGGMSGLEAARRVARCGAAEVVVAEAGAYGMADHVNAAYAESDIEKMWRMPGVDPSLWRPWDSTQPPHYAGSTGLRRQVGGRSLYWHGVVLRMDPWAVMGSEWWPAVLTGDDPQLYRSVERDLAAWTGRPLQGFRSLTEDNLLGWTRSIGCTGAERAPLAVQRFDTDAGPRWRAYSPLYGAWADGPAVRDNPRIQIRPGLGALELRVHAGRVQVRLSDSGTGRTSQLAADAVVLAAGTMENTRLVAQLLADRDATPREFVGLADHILQGFVVHLPEQVWGDGSGEGAIVMLRGDGENRSNLFAKLLDGPRPGSVTLDVWEMGEQEPSEVSALTFPCRKEPPWRPAVRIGLTPADLSLIAGQRRRLQQMWDAAAAALSLPGSRLDFGDYLAVAADADGYLDRAVARPGRAVGYANTLGGTDHESGTLPYGRMLDSSGQLDGIPGVFVVGPAAFPRGGAANPSLTTLALARHVGDQVVAFLGATRVATDPGR